MKRRRAIDTLRRLYPGRWTYEHEPGGPRRWVHEDGRVVVRYARLAPTHPSDDDSFVLEYRWDATGERVDGLFDGRLFRS